MAGSTAGRTTKVPEIRTGDTVVVLSGKDAGKRGKVESVAREPRATMITARRGRRIGTALSGATVIVTGLNIAKRHTKPRQTQGANDRMPKVQQGGIIDLAQPIPIGRVMLVCSHCERPTRVGHALLDSGKRVRVCGHCGEQLGAKP
jgi:large subunit ribosomal protein L24